MAISYSQLVTINGVAADPVISEIIFENKTISEGLVSFETGIKAGTIFSENVNTTTMQAWAVNPSASGTIGINDVLITPVKVEYLDSFTPNDLRTSRFNRDMKPGAWNDVSDEFAKMILNGVAKSISADAETKFWNGATSATKTAVAALTAGTANTSVGAAEKTKVAALPTGQIDGIVAKMIYNNSNATDTAGVGTRIKVAGTTVVYTNIKAEYDKIFTAIPAVALNQTEKPVLYAPKSHKQMIIQANNVTTDYTKPFTADASYDNIYFNGLKVEFVPTPENVVIAAHKSNLVWCTDLVADVNTMEINKIANNQEKMFLKNNMTLAAHVVNQKFNVLYVG